MRTLLSERETERAILLTRNFFSGKLTKNLGLPHTSLEINKRDRDNIQAIQLATTVVATITTDLTRGCRWPLLKGAQLSFRGHFLSQRVHNPNQKAHPPTWAVDSSGAAMSS